MTTLAERHCTPCRKGTPPLTAAQAEKSLAKLPDWHITTDGTAIHRVLKFKDYYHTLAFVNAVAWLAHQEDHHPTLVVEYNRCEVIYTTHAAGGLTDNDFICAAKIDRTLIVPAD